MTEILTGRYCIMLYATDVREAANWYVTHLGVALGPHSFDDFAELHVGGKNALHIFKADPAPVMHRPFFGLNVHDAESLHHSLNADGVEVTKLERRKDHVEFILSDLNGNKLYATQWT